MKAEQLSQSIKFNQFLTVSLVSYLLLKENVLIMLFVLFVLQSAASCYIELIVKESDNNVKLIVLDRLIAIKDNPSHEKVLRVSSVWLCAIHCKYLQRSRISMKFDFSNFL